MEKVAPVQAVQVFAALLKPNPALHPEQAPVVAVQAEQPVQVWQAVIPPVEKVPAVQAVQVFAAESKPNPAVHPAQAPVVAIQEEHPVQV